LRLRYRLGQKASDKQRSTVFTSRASVPAGGRSCGGTLGVREGGAPGGQRSGGHNSLGWVLMKTGKLERQSGQFRLAIKLNPDFVQAHINLANALSSRKTRSAASEARTAVKLAPTMPRPTERSAGR